MNKLSTYLQDERVIKLLRGGYAPKEVVRKLRSIGKIITLATVYHALERRRLRIRDIKLGIFGNK